MSGDHNQVNEHLARVGLCQLNDPTLIHQLAFLVESHEHFRRVLMKVEPSKRTEAYEAMKPYLRFNARPLFSYMLI